MTEHLQMAMSTPPEILRSDRPVAKPRPTSSFSTSPSAPSASAIVQRLQNALNLQGDSDEQEPQAAEPQIIVPTVRQRPPPPAMAPPPLTSAAAASEPTVAASLLAAETPAARPPPPSRSSPTMPKKPPMPSTKPFEEKPKSRPQRPPLPSSLPSSRDASPPSPSRPRTSSAGTSGTASTIANAVAHVSAATAKANGRASSLSGGTPPSTPLLTSATGAVVAAAAANPTAAPRSPQKPTRAATMSAGEEVARRITTASRYANAPRTVSETIPLKPKPTPRASVALASVGAPPSGSFRPPKLESAAPIDALAKPPRSALPPKPSHIAVPLRRGSDEKPTRRDSDEKPSLPPRAPRGPLSTSSSEPPGPRPRGSTESVARNMRPKSFSLAEQRRRMTGVTTEGEGISRPVGIVLGTAQGQGVRRTTAGVPEAPKGPGIEPVGLSKPQRPTAPKPVDSSTTVREGRPPLPSRASKPAPRGTTGLAKRLDDPSMLHESFQLAPSGTQSAASEAAQSFFAGLMQRNPAESAASGGKVAGSAPESTSPLRRRSSEGFDLQKVDPYITSEYTARKMRNEIKGEKLRHRVKVYPCCFRAKDAITWLLTSSIARDEMHAVRICNAMVRYGMMAHAADSSRPFEKGSMFGAIPPFYRWMDEMYWSRDGPVDVLGSISEDAPPAGKSEKPDISAPLPASRMEPMLPDGRAANAETTGAASGLAAAAAVAQRASTQARLRAELAKSLPLSAPSASAPRATREQSIPIATPAIAKPEQNVMRPAADAVVAQLRAAEARAAGSTQVPLPPAPPPRKALAPSSDPTEYMDVAGEESVPTTVRKAFLAPTSAAASSSATAAQPTATSLARVQPPQPQAILPQVSESEYATIDDVQDDEASFSEDDLQSEGFSDEEEIGDDATGSAAATALSRSPASLTVPDTEGGFGTSVSQRRRHSVLNLSIRDMRATLDDSMRESVQHAGPAAGAAGAAAQQVAGVSAPIAAVHATVANLWRNRPEVLASGLLDSMGKKAIARQDAINEIPVSERSYLEQLEALLKKFLLPLTTAIQMQNANTSINKATAIAEPISAEVVQELNETAKALKDTSQALLHALESRQKESLVVHRFADVMSAHVASLRYVFGQYIKCAAPAMHHLTKREAQVSEFLSKYASQSHQGLTLNSFVLAPVQRLAKYPLLLEAVLKQTEEDAEDLEELNQLLADLKDLVAECNELMRFEEASLELVELEDELDFRKIPEPEPIVGSARAIVRRGHVLRVIMNKDGRIAKTKPLELILLTDMVVVAKPVTATFSRAKTQRYEVRRMVHRSLVEVSAEPDVASDKECGKHLFSIWARSHRPDDQEHYLLHCKSETARQQWLGAFNPSDGEEEDYKEWNCPEVEAIAEWTAQSSEELNLSVGQIIKVVKRDAGGWSRGFYAHLPANVKLNPTKWFPTSYTQERLDNNYHRNKQLQLQSDRQGGTATNA